MFTQINSPADYFWRAPTRNNLIRLSSDRDLALNQLQAFASGGAGSKRVHLSNVVLELPVLNHLELIATQGRRWPALRLQLDDTQLGALHRRRGLLNRYRPVLVLTHCEISLARCVQFLASLQLPIEVIPQVWMAQDALAMTDLSERLLFSPFVKTPVQPFFDLLRSRLNPTGAPNLWDIFRERVGSFIYLTEDGHITLSKRWADGQRYFGRVDDTHHKLRTSELYRTLRVLQKGGYKLDPICADCTISEFCAGYMRAIDRKQDCSALITLLHYMGAHANGIHQAYRGLSAMDRRRLSGGTGPSSSPMTPPSPAEGNQTIETSAAIVLVPAQCTNTCTFCAPADNRNQGAHLSDDAIENFIQICGANGVTTLIFSGNGEPTLHPHLPELIACAAAAGIRRRVITSNGTAMSPELLTRLRQAGTDCVVFSLHGIDDTHDAVVRHSGSFNKIQRSLKFAKELGLDIGLNTCLLRDNLHQVKDLLELSGPICTMAHTLSFPEWSGNALRHTHRLPTYSEASRALADIDWAIDAHGTLDNFPICQTPPGAMLVHRPSQMAHLDFQGAKRVATTLNFGNNQIPSLCIGAACIAIDRCCGVDCQYLKARGSAELRPITGNAGNLRDDLGKGD